MKIVHGKEINEPVNLRGVKYKKNMVYTKWQDNDQTRKKVRIQIAMEETQQSIMKNGSLKGTSIKAKT